MDTVPEAQRKRLSQHAGRACRAVAPSGACYARRWSNSRALDFGCCPLLSSTNCETEPPKNDNFCNFANTRPAIPDDISPTTLILSFLRTIPRIFFSTRPLTNNDPTSHCADPNRPIEQLTSEPQSQPKPLLRNPRPRAANPTSEQSPIGHGGNHSTAIW